MGLGVGLRPNTKGGCISLTLWPHRFSVTNWWRTVKNRTTRDWFKSRVTRKRSREEHMLEVETFKCGWYLTSSSRLGQLVTWLVRCTASLFVCLSSFLYPHYKSSHYPWNCKENFREKTLEIHWRVKDCLPIILYTFFLVFLYSYLSNFISFEKFLAQTHTSPILSVVSHFGALEKH